ELARAASGLATCQVVPPDHAAFGALASVAQAGAREFGGDAAQLLLNAFAKLRRCGHEALFGALALELERRADELCPRDAAVLASAYASAAVASPGLSAALSARLAACAGELSPLDLANSVSVFARAHTEGAQALLSALAVEAANRLGDFEPRQLAGIGWAYARLHHAAAPRLLSGVAAHLARARGLERLGSQGLVNLLSAYARVQVHPRELLEGVEAHLMERSDVVRGMAQVDLLYTASSLARLGAGSPALFALVADAALASPVQPTAKQGIYLLQACSQAHCAHVGLFDGLSVSLRAALGGGVADGGLSASDWVVALGAYASTGLLGHSASTRALCREALAACCALPTPLRGTRCQIRAKASPPWTSPCCCGRCPGDGFQVPVMRPRFWSLSSSSGERSSRCRTSSRPGTLWSRCRHLRIQPPLEWCHRTCTASCYSWSRRSWSLGAWSGCLQQSSALLQASWRALGMQSLQPGGLSPSSWPGCSRTAQPRVLAATCGRPPTVSSSC
ncbi:unnamed protein product, partial [Prorocentrum cordatum]